MNRHPPLRPASRSGFEIVLICASALEADAIRSLFDFSWDHDGGPRYHKAMNDPNTYSTGAMGEHNVVLAYMPSAGKVNASTVATNCRVSFPNIRLALVVGICGYTSFTPDGKNIFPGDVIISDAVIQYDLGQQGPESFKRKDTLLESLGRPNQEIRTHLTMLKTLQARKRLREQTKIYLREIQSTPDLQAQFPGFKPNQLVNATPDWNTSLALQSGPLLSQEHRSPAIHFGLIGSGDTTFTSSKHRDDLAKKLGLIGFETESVGVWEVFPCVVIKSAYDYTNTSVADASLNQAWQHYGAATAAACTKAFLDDWTPRVAQEGLAQRIPMTPRYISIPYARNRKFTGRNSILEQIQQKLFLQQDCQSLAIVGLGGIGKTQIALQFAYLVKDMYPEYHILWVPCQSYSGFEQTYLDIGKNLGVPMDMNPGDFDPMDTDAMDIDSMGIHSMKTGATNINREDPKESVRRYLSSEMSGKWLLIIDNADDPDLVLGSTETPSIYKFLPESDTGLTVFTTRSMHIGLQIAKSDIVEVFAMDEEEAGRLFTNLIVHKQLLNNDTTQRELLLKLEHLPLAITQAAAFLNYTYYSVEKYLELLHRIDEQDILRLVSHNLWDDKRDQNTHHAVAMTWIVSFEQIKKTHKAAADLLAFISCLEPKAIPRSLLLEFSSEDIDYTISTLFSYSFLRGWETNEVYDMHSLVHLATRIWIQNQGYTEEVTKGALCYINAAIRSAISSTNRWLWKLYQPHAIRLIERSKAYVFPHRFGLLRVVGIYSFFFYQYTLAISYLEEFFQYQKEQNSEPCIHQLNTIHYLGLAYIHEGRTRDAIQLLEPIVRSQQEIHDEANRSAFDLGCLLAKAYTADNRSEDAIQLLQPLVQSKQETFKNTDHSQLAAKDELVYAYLRGGKTEDAIKLLKPWVGSARANLEMTDPRLLKAEQLLAQTFLQCDLVSNAIEILEPMVRLQQEMPNIVDRQWFRSDSLLADAYEKVGRLEDAIRLRELIVQRQSEMLDTSDSQRQTSEFLLAALYLESNRTEDAIRLLEPIVKLLQKASEADSGQYLTRHVLAKAYMQHGRTLDAIPLLESILKSLQGTVGEIDSIGLKSVDMLVNAYMHEGRVEDAFRLLQSVCGSS